MEISFCGVFLCALNTSISAKGQLLLKNRNHYSNQVTHQGSFVLPGSEA